METMRQAIVELNKAQNSPPWFLRTDDLLLYIFLISAAIPPSLISHIPIRPIGFLLPLMAPSLIL